MILLTGVAGFIGYHVAEGLLARGQAVLGLDNLNAYYDPALKRARLEQLVGRPGFAFLEADIADHAAMDELGRVHGARLEGIVHLAAQAGVRHSLKAPFDYLRSNLDGHLTVLELARQHAPRLRHLVYASSSSVYGGNTKTPFSVEDRVDQPVSLYAATKRADELISHAYAHLYGIPQTGLRFFTVYGPWGRPDMAAYIFADAIATGRPITLYNHGKMQRDFTYVDDVTAGVLAALERPPAAEGAAPHRVLNLGNHRPCELGYFVEVLERAMGRKAEVRLAPIEPGDVPTTFADIEESRRVLGFEPRTPIEEGLPRFVAWYRAYHRLA